MSSGSYPDVATSSSASRVNCVQKEGVCGVVRIASFFALLAVSIVLLHHAVSGGLRKIPTSKFGALNRVMNGEAKTDLLISGSSRALNHYDTRELETVAGFTAYNIGIASSQIDFQLVMLRTYLAHNEKPRLIIHNLDLFSFVTTHTREIYDPGLYFAHLDDVSLYEGLCAIDPAVWKWRHIPLYGYAAEDLRFTWLSGLLAWLRIYPREDYIRGFNPRFAQWSEDFGRFQERNVDGVSYPIEENGVKALEQLLELSSARGVPLILVYSPEYYEVQLIERNRAQIFAKFQEIANKFDVPFWDYSDSAICRDRANFFNSQHLNAGGAALFSRELAKRLSQREIPATRLLEH